MIDRTTLPFDEAIALIPEGDTIHTIRQFGASTLGADIPRAELMEKLKVAFLVKRAGAKSTRIGHGLALLDERGWLFVETKNLSSIEVSRG